MPSYVIVVPNQERSGICEREQLKDSSRLFLLFQQHWGSYFLLLRPPAAGGGGAIRETSTRHLGKCLQQDQRTLETLQRV